MAVYWHQNGQIASGLRTPQMQTRTSQQLTQFAQDVLAGLTSTPKSLSSKYFYDDEGSRLFQQIMELPEYYLTRAESEIFGLQAAEIYNDFANGSNAFDLIELGAGDGRKTALLISHFLQRDADISYSPIDISQEALKTLSKTFAAQFPTLKIETRKGDYFQILESLKNESGRRKVILFLGSNIGNFSREHAIDFFRRLGRVMNDDDLLFVGFDLQKDPHVIVDAYDDAQGVTAEFNINLLRRINRELGGHFDLEKWSHYAIYRPVECAARSFLISRANQNVHIKALGRSFDFEQWEAVFMEISQKYSQSDIADFAREAGFGIKRNFLDSRNYYCNSLWKTASTR